jgi:hypothetical protein
VKEELIVSMIDRCNYKFDKKVLYSNNFSNYDIVKHQANALISRNIIDEYFILDEYATKALSFFGLTKEGFKGGYHYSIAELVSIYLCQTDYNLHFSGDAMMESNCTVNWIDPAIQLMERNTDVIVANPT